MDVGAQFIAPSSSESACQEGAMNCAPTSYAECQEKFSTRLRATYSHSSGVSSGIEQPFARMSLRPFVCVTAAIISLIISVSPQCVNGPRSASHTLRHLYVM